jgi:hypothetical protein
MRDILADVQEAAAKKIEYTVHATEQMANIIAEFAMLKYDK